MDINKTLAELKKEPGFADQVGMVLIHNGVVRGFSRNDHKAVASITVEPDMDKIHAICREKEKQPGIFRIVAQCKSGMLKPGDDVMLLIVAGDIREHVKHTLSDLLDTIKKEAVFKQEVFME